MGNPWRESHGHGGSYSSSYSNSYSNSFSNSYSSSEPPGPWSSHHAVEHHRWRTTTTSHPTWPSIASDHHSVATISSHTPTPLPIPHTEHSLSHPALAAAIVVPIFLFFSAIALVCLSLRRRRRKSPQGEPPVAVAAAAGGIKEKLGSFRRRSKPPPPPPAMTMNDPAPIVTSHENNAYYTGLDTSSLGSRGESGEYQLRASYESPPPPYVHEAPQPPSLGYADLGAGSAARSPFDDPEPEYDDHIADGMMFVRPDTAQTTNHLSTASTLYSANAPTPEPKEARRSRATAYTIDTSIASEDDGDPFASPTISPVDSPSSAARGSFAGGHGYRRMSDVSEIERS